ncbi:MAG TPA: hypothetical protein VNJ07_11585, partial [Chitinophagales bacterium]|nr:hypothetical protein [Chitinophagales bacterium]
MKTIKQFSFIALIFLLCMPSKSFAQYFNLYVLDPQARWYTGNATIDEASLTIKPAGIYFEYGLHLTISAKGTQFEGSATLPLEIVMNFCLPERAIIHDSWLWVNTGDTLTRKIWAGNFIYAREQEQQLNSTKREIIDTSLANRVLSLYTAFLALEPNDTISACETCEDDSDNTNTT